MLIKHALKILLIANFLTWGGLSAIPSPDFTIALLPYAGNALEPYISERTLSLHHGKHHQANVDKLNDLLLKTEWIKLSLEDIIHKTKDDVTQKELFNNAAQHWNHTFYWSSMKANGGGKPTGAIAEKINKDFGNYETFRKQFVDAGVKQFGSGWVWLVLEGGLLKIVSTGNADLPLIHGQKPILVCDIWEHAYYLDYQNKRKDYVEVFLDHLVDWGFANKNLAKP